VLCCCAECASALKCTHIKHTHTHTHNTPHNTTTHTTQHTHTQHTTLHNTPHTPHTTHSRLHCGEDVDADLASALSSSLAARSSLLWYSASPALINATSRSATLKPSIADTSATEAAFTDAKRLTQSSFRPCCWCGLPRTPGRSSVMVGRDSKDTKETGRCPDDDHVNLLVGDNRLVGESTRQPQLGGSTRGCLQPRSTETGVCVVWVWVLCCVCVFVVCVLCVSANLYLCDAASRTSIRTNTPQPHTPHATQHTTTQHTLMRLHNTTHTHITLHLCSVCAHTQTQHTQHPTCTPPKLTRAARTTRGANRRSMTFCQTI